MDKQLKKLKGKQRSTTVNEESRKRILTPDLMFGLPDDEDYNLDVKKKKRDAHKNASRGKNYCNNNVQSKSTNRFSAEDYSMISKRLAKVEKRPQNKRQISVINTYGVPIVGKENNFGGAMSLSPRKTLSMGRFGPPRSSSFVWDSEPQPVMEFPTTLVTHHVNPSASYTNSTFKKFREILNKLNSGNVEKLYQEFLTSVGPDDTFPELATFIFNKAINEVDSPTSSTLYAQLMARACNNVNMKNLSVELRKASMDHFSKLCGLNEASSSSSEFQHGDISISRRSKGILRFIGELFKVGIIPFSDMNYFVDWLLLHPEESNLHHLCNLLKLTGSLLETKSYAIESGVAANLNYNHTSTWFGGVCDELERQKDCVNNMTKSDIMGILELRDEKWTMQEPSNIQQFLKPPTESGGNSTLWRETQQQNKCLQVEIHQLQQKLVTMSEQKKNKRLINFDDVVRHGGRKRRFLERGIEFDPNGKDYIECKAALKKDENGRWPCPKCTSSLSTKWNCLHHIQNIHLGLQFPCTECEYIATDVRCLKTHIKIVHFGGLKYTKDLQNLETVLVLDFENENDTKRTVLTRPFLELYRNLLFGHWTCSFSPNPETGEPPAHKFASGFYHMTDTTSLLGSVNKIISKCRTVDHADDTLDRARSGCGNLKGMMANNFHLDLSTLVQSDIYSIGQVTAEEVKHVMRDTIYASYSRNHRDGRKLITEDANNHIKTKLSEFTTQAARQRRIWNAWAVDNCNYLVDDALKDEPSGLTVDKIIDFILKSRMTSAEFLRPQIEEYLQKGIDDGTIVQTKSQGDISYTLL